MSVPAADAVDKVEFSRIFIADAPSGVPSAVPGALVVPVGVSAFRIRLIIVLSMAAI
jgi:hypothetical protein